MGERHKLAQQARQARARQYSERQARVEQMEALRDSGLTLAQIGEQHHVTRERVRQLIGSRKRPPRQPPWPRKYFRRTMRQWLWDANFRKCAICKIWSCEVSVAQRRCKECNRQNVRAVYATEHGREVQKLWQANNRDRMKVYQSRWRLKQQQAHPDKTRRPCKVYAADPQHDLGVEDLLNALRSIVQRRVQQAVKRGSKGGVN